MAKVTGPLMSMSASGKLGEAIVFFTWKGLNVVRQWVSPSNPQTTSQGDRRIIIGGTGRAAAEIVVDSAFHQQLIDLELIPNGQTKQSYMVKYILDNYLLNATSYSTELAAIKANAVSDDWATAANTLDVLEFDLDYATIAPYDKRLGLYLMAKAAIALDFTGTPYSIGLSTWTATQINLFVSDLTLP